MATPDSIQAKLLGLLSKSADKTGVFDSDLTSAVNRLIDGYGESLSSEATATADDIVAPKTAVVNGELITGNIKTAHGGVTAYVTPEMAGGMPFVKMSHTLEEPTYISPNTGGKIRMYAPFEDFGNAGKEDVVAGKTFTSVAGFQEVGTAKTYDEGKADGVEAGKKAQYDEFWDRFQNYGDRTQYRVYAFAGYGFSFKNFYPKYDIKPVGDASYMFYAWTDLPVGESVGDLVQRLDDCGVILDVSKATYLDNMFNWSRFTRLPVIDLTGLTKNSKGRLLFASNGQLVTIDKIVINENTEIDRWFDSCTALENLAFEGTIGQNGLNLQWSTKLSKASIESIINALSSTTSGLSITLSKTAKETAFTDTEWANLIATKPNWTINLI